MDISAKGYETETLWPAQDYEIMQWRRRDDDGGFAGSVSQKNTRYLRHTWNRVLEDCIASYSYVCAVNARMLLHASDSHAARRIAR